MIGKLIIGFISGIILIIIYVFLFSSSSDLPLNTVKSTNNDISPLPISDRFIDQQNPPSKDPGSSTPPKNTSTTTTKTDNEQVTTKNISYSSKHKQRSYSVLPAKESDPIFIWVHGGGWSEGSKNDPKYIDFWKKIRSNGFNVYTVDYRLSGDAKWPAQINDLKCMLSYLSANPETPGDPQKIVLGGHSAGGHLVLMTGMTTNDQFSDDCEWQNNKYNIKGIVASSPPIDLQILSNEGFTNATALLGFDPRSNPTESDKASPINFVSKDDPSIGILTGSYDRLTEATKNGEALKKAFLDVGININLVNYPNGKHNLEIYDLNTDASKKFIGFVNNFK